MTVEEKIALWSSLPEGHYSIQGAQIEVWMFEDHLEVRSPGLPPNPITVEALNRRERLHLSRNPLIMRVLAELEYVRELGEGIPRMFNEMEREGFYPPRFENIGGAFFGVTLRNQPVYDRATLEWLRQFEPLDLTGDHKRLLAYAQAHSGTFTSREYQRLVGLDLYGASNSIKVLIRKGVVRSTAKGSRVYEILTSGAQLPTPPAELQRLLPLLRARGSIRNGDVREVLGLTYKSASRLLDRLVSDGWLERTGERRGTRYITSERHYGTASL